MNDREKHYPVIYLVTACNKVGPIQQTLNIIKYLDRDRFEPILVTLYDEPADGTSQLDKFLALGVQHNHVATGKKDIIIGNLSRLKKTLEKINPSVIHSLGVFPDYAVGRLGYNDRQIIVLRNYMHDDYLSKFGAVQGRILETLQMHAVHRAKKVVTCSKSLASIYKQKNGLDFDYISNGVDTEAYCSAGNKRRKELRQKLDLPADKTILVYSGQFVPRKNQQLVLHALANGLLPETAYLLLLGDGPELEPLREKYGQLTDVDFRGMVINVNEYLQCADIYISASKSEGLPNGVLEAMAVGLPVVLSDIPQHREIVENDQACGRLFSLSDENNFASRIKEMMAVDFAKARAAAQRVVAECYDARVMSLAYQSVYNDLMR